jgi:hypothetical protein
MLVIHYEQEVTLELAWKEQSQHFNPNFFYATHNKNRNQRQIHDW